MEKLAHRLAQRIGREVNADSEKIAVMAYGLTALLQLLFIFAAAVLLGLLFDFFPQAMIVFFSVGLLRRLIGGVHAGSCGGCLTISIFCVALFSALSRYVLPSLGVYPACAVAAVIYLLAAVLIYRLAPVDSEKKPVRNPKKIKRLRRSAFSVLVLFAAVTAAALLLPGVSPFRLSCVWALDISVLWQVWMLTGSGARVIGFFDRRIIK